MLFDYNRYMYVRGNPLKYTDPTGHVPLPLLTGAAGLVLGGAAYIISESMQDDGFNLAEDWTDLAVAAGSGAVSGAMIFTPGIGMAPMGIGMAAAQLGDHALNTMMGEDFSAGEHLAGSVVGGASGFVAGPAANLGKTVVTRRVAQSAAIAVTEGAGQVVVDSVDGQGTAGSFIAGATWGLLGSGYGNLVELGTKGLSPNQETVWNGAFNTMWEFYKGGSQWVLDPSQHQMQ